MKKLIKTLTLTAAGLVVGAVVLKRVSRRLEVFEVFEVFIDGNYLANLPGNLD